MILTGWMKWIWSWHNHSFRFRDVIFAWWSCVRWGI